MATLGKNNKVELKPIALGRDLGAEVEILSGVSADDRIIDSPPDSLANGDMVKVQAEHS